MKVTVFNNGMEIITKWGCKWKVKRYVSNNPELYYKNRIKLTCIESDNEVYSAGDTIDCADTNIYGDYS